MNARARASVGRGEVNRVRVKAPRLVSTNDGMLNAKGDQASSEYKLHLAMDSESFAKLRWLKAVLEASTDAEVVRRALKVYEIFAPADESGDRPGPNLDDYQPNGVVEHLYIRIPARMKARLEAEHEKFGRSYGEQVRQALRVSMQLAREREFLKGLLSKGGDTDTSHNKEKDRKEPRVRDCAASASAYQKLAVLY
jgi:hypothetical protein